MQRRILAGATLALVLAIGLVGSARVAKTQQPLPAAPLESPPTPPLDQSVAPPTVPAPLDPPPLRPEAPDHHKPPAAPDLPSQPAEPIAPPTAEPDDLLPSAIGSASPASGNPKATANDPMQAVNAFVDRSRKEAADSIQALTKEAEDLRARLNKVEAALGRWKAVAGALAQDHAPWQAARESSPGVLPPPGVEPPTDLAPLEPSVPR